MSRWSWVWWTGLGITGVARADGSNALGGDQEVKAETPLFVDVIDFANETVTWNGKGSVDIYDPAGAFAVTLNPGDTFVPTANGAHQVALSAVQDSTWDIAVSNAAPTDGRVWSYRWSLNNTNFADATSMNESLFALVDGGAPGQTAVIELKANGMSGLNYAVQASMVGLDDANGRSALGDERASSPQRLYLKPPELASHSLITPVVTGLGADWGACGAAIPTDASATITFTSNVSGTYHLVCDLDGDGVFDPSSDADAHRSGAAIVGVNAVEWDGTTNLDLPYGDGTGGAIDCLVRLTVGEVHFLTYDLENSFEGFALFEVRADRSRAGLNMFWNDGDIQADDVDPMLDGTFAIATSGPNGVPAGAYAATRIPNVNARSWGEFDGVGAKGDNNTTDTSAWLAESVSALIPVLVADVTIDDDADGLPDAGETCVHETSLGDADSDDDGLTDGDEARGLGPLASWGPTDPTETDTDGDGVLDGTEAGVVVGVGADTDLAVFVPDADSATTTDPTSPDTDGDGLLDGEEDANHDGATSYTLGGTGTTGSGETDPSAADTDGDGQPDGVELESAASPLDLDSDDDSLPDEDEADSLTDPADPDTDGDGLTDGDEVLTHGSDPRDGDTDNDGLADVDEVAASTDPGSRDTDGDGLSDAAELHTHRTNPLLADSDGDGLADGEETATSKTLPLASDTDRDGLGDGDEGPAGTDPFDPDTDDDGLLDGEESTYGTDPTSADSDDGGVTDGIEVRVTDTDPTDDRDDALTSGIDTDGDELSDSLEVALGTSPVASDTDGDGVADRAELTGGTHPLRPDTDGDGLEDGAEPDSDPRIWDTDGDGLADGFEVVVIGTAPDLADTDSDGLLDSDELDTFRTRPGSVDVDGDALSDGEEVTVHGTSPLAADSDGDGLADGDELTEGTNPLDRDSDGGGAPDGAETATDPLQADDDPELLIDTDGDGLANLEEAGAFGTSPAQTDSDSDGLTDGDEALVHHTDPTRSDTDGDGVSDGDEVSKLGTDPRTRDTDGDGLDDPDDVDPLAADRDDDRLEDGEELLLFSTDPAESDSDGDALPDGDEVRTYGSDPLVVDTDGGGVGDGAEVANDTDPLNPLDDFSDGSTTDGGPTETGDTGTPEIDGYYGGCDGCTSGATPSVGWLVALSLVFVARRRVA